MPAEDEAESTTKATVSEGEIEIRDKENQKQDLAGLNRDTQNALNKLGEIFDKDSIEERQELAGLFGELAYNQIHFMEGTDEQKAAYHALVGGIMAELTNGDFIAGASAAAVNKLVSDKIVEAANGDPAMAQWLSAVVGAVVSDIAGENAQSGASIAASGIKNNLFWEYIPEFRKSLMDIDVSNIPYGYCRIVSYGITPQVMGIDTQITDAAIVFNDYGESTFSCFGGGVGKGGFKFDTSATVGIGGLYDPYGNLVTDYKVIEREMQGFSFGYEFSVIGGIGEYWNTNGYKFKVEFVNPNLGGFAVTSYTRLLGDKYNVANGVF